VTYDSAKGPVDGAAVTPAPTNTARTDSYLPDFDRAGGAAAAGTPVEPVPGDITAALRGDDAPAGRPVEVVPGDITAALRGDDAPARRPVEPVPGDITAALRGDDAAAGTPATGTPTEVVPGDITAALRGDDAPARRPVEPVPGDITAALRGDDAPARRPAEVVPGDIAAALRGDAAHPAAGEQYEPGPAGDAPPLPALGEWFQPGIVNDANEVLNPWQRYMAERMAGVGYTVTPVDQASGQPGQDVIFRNERDGREATGALRHADPSSGVASIEQIIGETGGSVQHLAIEVQGFDLGLADIPDGNDKVQHAARQMADVYDRALVAADRDGRPVPDAVTFVMDGLMAYTRTQADAREYLTTVAG
jgi:hypothetical protein